MQLFPEGKVNSGGSGAKRPGKYLTLFTEPDGDSCFSIY